VVQDDVAAQGYNAGESRGAQLPELWEGSLGPHFRGVLRRVRILPLARVYFERGTGNAVVDEGPGTERVERPELVMHGTFSGSGDHPQDRPRWWLVGANCRINVTANLIVLWSQP